MEDPVNGDTQGRRDESFPASFADDLTAMGVKAYQMSLNLAEFDACERLLDAVDDTVGPPSILVNNATHCKSVSYREMTTEILDMYYAVNVRGTCMLSTHFVKRYGAHGGGRIISLVS